MAQALLDASEAMGEKRVATYSGIAFVAQRTHPGQDVWHGYPEGWEMINAAIVSDWLRRGLITRRQVTRWWRRDMLRAARVP